MTLVFLNKSANPRRSVINPGVINKIPETTMKKPSPRALISCLGSLNEVNLIRFRVLIPSFFIKVPPPRAVKIISTIVYKEPMNSLILINK